MKWYNVGYDDKTYYTYKLTTDDYEKLKKAVNEGYDFVEFSFGFLSLKGLRFVVEREEDEKPNEAEDAPPPQHALDWMIYLDEGEEVIEDDGKPV